LLTGGLRMATRQLQTPSSLHVLTNTLLILAQMLLLIVVWSIFFLWALLVTENLLVPWLTAWAGGQNWLNTFWITCIGIYLPAFVLVMISLMLFFYRMPLAQDKVSVSLEFAITILLFIAAHLFVSTLVLPWADGCLPTWASISQALASDGLPVQTCHHPAANLLFTTLALVLLFWHQGPRSFLPRIRARYTHPFSL
jgi:hypothetical protein